ncbi:MAG: hypothetical protein ABEH83_11095 [Halobacterium sp.]
MPSRLYEECPACGWAPECEYVRDDRELGSEARHERVVEHVRSTDDVFHDRVEDVVEQV